MIVYHHRGGSCCTIDYNPPKRLLCLWEITLRAVCIRQPHPPHPPPLALCNYTIRPDCRLLKVIIDLGVLIAHRPPGAHGVHRAAASFFLSLCCLSRDKQCSRVENPSDLTGPLSTNTEVFLVLWTLPSIRVSLEVSQAPWKKFSMYFFLLFVHRQRSRESLLLMGNRAKCCRRFVCLFVCLFCSNERRQDARRFINC